MKFRVLLFLMTGALLSMVAGFGTYHYASALESELATARTGLQAMGETVAVPVAAHDVAAGSVLHTEDFRLLTLPRSFVPAHVLTMLPPRGPDQTLVALMPLRADSLILRSDLARASPNPQFGFLLAEDGSAIAVAPENMADFQPILRPGDVVDLVWTRPTGGGTSESRLIGSALRVLALPGQAAQFLPTAADDPAAESGPAAASGTAEDNMIAATMPGAVVGKLLLEATAPELLRFVQAEKSGVFQILPSGGRRDLAANELVVGPAELAGLPLLVRDSARPIATAAPIAVASPSNSRERCQTAVVRGGSRTVVEVPC